MNCKPGDLAIIVAGPPPHVAVHSVVILRPIRDPGEDARDETLEWLPSPAQLEAMS